MGHTAPRGATVHDAFPPFPQPKKTKELNGLTFKIRLSFWIQDILLLAYMRRLWKRDQCNDMTKKANIPKYNYIL